MALNTRKAAPAVRMAKAAAKPAKKAPASLDRLIHERVRLALLSALAANPGMNFERCAQELHGPHGSAYTGNEETVTE